MRTAAAMVKSALNVLLQSSACVSDNERLLSETRYRIAASRRRLNPAFALSGSSSNGADGLRGSVRDRLASGALFPVGSYVMAGNGSGKPCVVCRESITRADVEYEIPLGEHIAVVAHLACYLVWRDESTRALRDIA